MKKRLGILGITLAIFLLMLACQSPLATPAQNTNLIETQTSLEMTLSAVDKSLPTATLPPAPTKTIPAINTPMDGSGSLGQTQPNINSANILVYEDAAGVPGALRVVSKVLAKLDAHVVNVGDAIGTLMQNLESSTKWDLIIISSEFRNSIQGEFWTAIQQHVDEDDSALIAEIWYLDKISASEIEPFLEECGIAYQKDLRRGSGFNQIEYEMFWSEPDSPVFNTPNTVERFRFALRSASTGNVGDYVQVTDASKATILASRNKDDNTDMGLLTSCMNDTVLWQTFRTHDYESDEMILLWENYITYVLTNHFNTTR